jgi:hypothetical protein
LTGTKATLAWLIDGAKISRYLLDEASPRGAPKAKYLMRFGFTPCDPKALADALFEHAMRNLPGGHAPEGPSQDRLRRDGDRTGWAGDAAANGLGAARGLRDAVHHRRAPDALKAGADARRPATRAGPGDGAS